jgi:molybdopterin-guanine dinucleotide biosynthesis protein A
MTDSSEIKVNGLVLAGGKSSRMGYDKSLIDYHGKPQREYLFDILSRLCKKVFISCRKNHQVPNHLNPLIDQFEIESPLNGILTAMTHDPHVSWLVVAVDMPMANERAIQYLLDHRDKEKVATCYIDSEHKNPEPLFSIWETKAVPLVKEFCAKGKFSPRDFLKGQDIQLLTPPSADVNININTPDELNQFKNKKQ